MRTPTLAFAILTVISPLALAAPLKSPGRAIANGTPIVTGGTLAPASAVHARDSEVVRRPVIGTVVSGFPKVPSPQQFNARALDKDTAGGNAYSGSAGDASGGRVGNLNHDDFTSAFGSFDRRTDDADTLGGNAYTGNSGDVNGGSIANIANNEGMPTIMNVDSNNAGLGGTSMSGCATGGYTDKSSAAGNAYSGTAGDAKGGTVSDVGGMVNYGSNNAGDAGSSITGCATGGNVDKLPTTTNQDFIL